MEDNLKNTEKMKMAKKREDQYLEKVIEAGDEKRKTKEDAAMKDKKVDEDSKMEDQDEEKRSVKDGRQRKPEENEKQYKKTWHRQAVQATGNLETKEIMTKLPRQ